MQESRIVFNNSINSNGETSKFQYHDWGTGFQLIHGNAEGFYSTNEYDGVGNELILLAEQVKKKNKMEIAYIKPLDQSILKSEVDFTLHGNWSKQFDIESDILVNDINGLMQDWKDVANYSINLEGLFIRKNFQSTDLLDITQAFSLSLLTIELHSKTKSFPTMLFDVFGGLTKKDLNWENIENRISELGNQFIELSKANRLESGYYDVVLSPDTAYSLAHETIGHGCEADQIITETSFLSGKMGHKVASTEITIVDDPHIYAAGWSEYDDEGMKTQGTLLVDEGILVGYLHNKKTAKMMNTLSTGNARATSYLSPPEPRQTNIFIEPKDYKFDELLENVRDGIFIGPSISASTSIFSGEFSIEFQYCYKIKNGEIDQIMGPGILSGLGLDCLNNITAVGNDVTTFPALCMKDDSRMFIGAISPSFSIDRIKIN